MVTVAIIILAVLILVIFIIIRNCKDKKELLSPGPNEDPVEEEKMDIQRRKEKT